MGLLLTGNADDTVFNFNNVEELLIGGGGDVLKLVGFPLIFLDDNGFIV